VCNRLTVVGDETADDTLTLSSVAETDETQLVVTTTDDSLLMSALLFLLHRVVEARFVSMAHFVGVMTALPVVLVG